MKPVERKRTGADPVYGRDKALALVRQLRRELELYVHRPKSHALGGCRLGKCLSHALLDELEQLIERGAVS